MTTICTVFCPKMLCVIKINKVVAPVVHFKNNVTTSSAVSAVWTTIHCVFVTQKTYGAIATISCRVATASSTVGTSLTSILRLPFCSRKSQRRVYFIM